MNSQDARIWIIRNYDQIKHWLIVVIGFTLITFALLSYSNSNRLLKQVSVLTEQNKILSEQNKSLNEATYRTGGNTQNVVLQNRNYIQCLSKIFAEYTHNFVPITIQDLDTCSIRTDGTSGASSQGTSSSPASEGSSTVSSQGSSGSSSNTNTDNTGGQSNNSQRFFIPGGQGLIRDSVPVLGRL